jgi:hypothetical protein
MLSKSKKISNSQVFLKIDPKNNMSRNIGIIIMVTFSIISYIIIFQIITKAHRPQLFIPYNIIWTFFLCFINGIFFIVSKPRALLFTENGITNGFAISILWQELQSYNFISIPNIGHNNGRSTLYIIPKDYFTNIGLNRRIYFRGLFFSTAEIAQAEEIFKAKGVAREL